MSDVKEIYLSAFSWATALKAALDNKSKVKLVISASNKRINLLNQFLEKYEVVYLHALTFLRDGHFCTNKLKTIRAKVVSSDVNSLCRMNIQQLKALTKISRVASILEFHLLDINTLNSKPLTYMKKGIGKTINLVIQDNATTYKNISKKCHRSYVKVISKWNISTVHFKPITSHAPKYLAFTKRWLPSIFKSFIQKFVLTDYQYASNFMLQYLPLFEKCKEVRLDYNEHSFIGQRWKHTAIFALFLKSRFLVTNKHNFINMPICDIAFVKQLMTHLVRFGDISNLRSYLFVLWIKFSASDSKYGIIQTHLVDTTQIEYKSVVLHN